jgi:hypothetical protein
MQPLFQQLFFFWSLSHAFGFAHKPCEGAGEGQRLHIFDSASPNQAKGKTPPSTALAADV